MKRTAILGIFFGMLPLVAAQAAAGAGGGGHMFLSDAEVMGAIGQMHAKFGAAEKARFERGVRQVAGLWREPDGDAAGFVKFCLEHFMTGEDREALFARFQANLEALGGHFLALSLQLRRQFDEDRGKLLPADLLFTAFEAGAHLNEDLFTSKLAFVALLNFPAPTFEESLKQGERWSRRQWAEARLGQAFAHRVPAEVVQALSKAYADADNYVTSLNVRMDKVVGADGKPLFREGLRLISHWGLRDELKALYVDPVKNLPLQQVIQTIMERIIHQEIPVAVIDNDKRVWDPVANTVDGKPSPRDPDTRYARLLSVFQAHQLENPHYPDAPTHVDRRFKLQREVPEPEMRSLLESVLDAPVGRDVAALIEKRLGRKLQPFDVWYDGFKARSGISQEELDKKVGERYPTLAAFQKDLPGILGKLGFDPATADFLAQHIVVDPARGSGHAWGPGMRGEMAHLRTRVPKEGMNYKGFNIAMHELGHNVEQVFSLYRLDHTLLQGVPNTAFTEGFAFVFQARDLEVLGMARPDAAAEAMKVLDDFWSTREIAGVGLVDMGVWRWMLEHPAATPAQLREAVVSVAKEVWNRFYAPVFGVQDTPLLAIYSHMINNGLYLPDYPLGHIIAFQVEDYFKTHALAKDMERLCAQGKLLPNLWMKQGIGAPISVKPMIGAAAKALKVLQK